MNLLDDKTLNKMWNVATNSSLESGLPPHHIFARLLYTKLTKATKTKTKVGMYESQSSQRPPFGVL